MPSHGRKAAFIVVRPEAGMDESDRPLIVERENQPLAIEIGLGQHDEIEHRGGNRLRQVRGRPAQPAQISASRGGSSFRKVR